MVAKRIKALIMAGVIVGLTAGSSLACDLKTWTTYQIAGDGTGSVGPFVNGTVQFNGDGSLDGVIYGRWYGHGDCVMNWTGSYQKNNDQPGLGYSATVTATGDCIPKNAQPKTLILIPSNGGNHFGWGIYNDSSHIHGEGNIQD